MRCATCGKNNPDGTPFCKSCGKPLVGFSISGSPASSDSFATPDTPRQPAGFWLRFVAACIDFIILALLVGVVTSFTAVAMGTWKAFLNLKPGESPAQVISAFGMQAMFIIFASFVIGGWLYFSTMESSVYNGTIGKMIVGLRVTDAQGRRVSFGRASGRFAGGRLLASVPHLGGLYFLVDCIFVAFTPEKRAIHDMCSGCLVLRKTL